VGDTRSQAKGCSPDARPVAAGVGLDEDWQPAVPTCAEHEGTNFKSSTLSRENIFDRLQTRRARHHPRDITRANHLSHSSFGSIRSRVISRSQTTVRSSGTNTKKGDGRDQNKRAAVTSGPLMHAQVGDANVDDAFAALSSKECRPVSNATNSYPLRASTRGGTGNEQRHPT
jgi:hypothetical protein